MSSKFSKAKMTAAKPPSVCISKKPKPTAAPPGPNNVEMAFHQWSGETSPMEPTTYGPLDTVCTRIGTNTWRAIGFDDQGHPFTIIWQIPAGGGLNTAALAIDMPGGPLLASGDGGTWPGTIPFNFAGNWNPTSGHVLAGTYGLKLF